MNFYPGKFEKRLQYLSPNNYSLCFSSFILSITWISWSVHMQIRKKTQRTKITHLLHAMLQFTVFPFLFALTVLWETKIISSETNEVHRKVCQQTEASVSISQTAVTFNRFNTPLHCFIVMRDERLFIHPLPILDGFSSPVQSLEADWQLTTTWIEKAN